MAKTLKRNWKSRIENALYNDTASALRGRVIESSTYPRHGVSFAPKHFVDGLSVRSVALIENSLSCVAQCHLQCMRVFALFRDTVLHVPNLPEFVDHVLLDQAVGAWTAPEELDAGDQASTEMP